MGDYAGSYDHTGDEEVNYVVTEDLEDWSWMHTTRTADAEALNEGEYYNEESDEYYNEGDGINYTYDSSQQVGTTSGYGHRRVRSASAGIKDVEESGSSENEVEVKPKTKNLGQFRHLREPPLDAHSDPGYEAGSYQSTDHPELATSHSINRVTSWLRDASLDEHESETTTTTTPRSPPKRRPPPRCPPPRCNPPAADMTSHHQMDQCDYEAPCYDKTPAWDPSGDQYGYSEDHQLAIHNSDSFASWSVYRPEPKGLEKALKLMRTGAVGLASASKTAAVGLKSRSIEFGKLAVPVLTPIVNAVIEESIEQLMVLDQGRGRAPPIFSEEGQGRGRGQARGRAQAARPTHPTMRPDMMPGRPMRPLMRPGMIHRPLMRPNMIHRPLMKPGMIHRPLMRPGMGPPCSQPMAPRPNMMPPPLPPSGGAPPIARGQGVPMRGQPQPMRGRARPAPTTTPTDF